MNLTLTCTACATQRDAQPYEQYPSIGGQTSAHCTHCRDTTIHSVGIPARRPVELEFERRKAG